MSLQPNDPTDADMDDLTQVTAGEPLDDPEHIADAARTYAADTYTTEED